MDRVFTVSKYSGFQGFRCVKGFGVGFTLCIERVYRVLYIDEQDFPGADWELLDIHTVPTKPGYVRLLVRIMMAGHSIPLVPRLASKLLPKWAAHLGAMDITDGDTVLLSEQASALSSNP